MTIIFKRTGCNMIEIPNASTRDINIYCRAAANCSTYTHDLEYFEIKQDELKQVNINER